MSEQQPQPEDFVYKFIDPRFPEDYSVLLGRAIGLEKLLSCLRQEMAELREEHNRQQGANDDD